MILNNALAGSVYLEVTPTLERQKQDFWIFCLPGRKAFSKCLPSTLYFQSCKSSNPDHPDSDRFANHPHSVCPQHFQIRQPSG